MRKLIKIFVLVVVALLFCNCINEKNGIPFTEQMEIRNYEANSYTSEIVSFVELNLPTMTTIEKFSFEGHDYIRFKFNGGNSLNSGIVHNPECRKCKAEGR